jgi:hypothetical protein
MKGKPISAARFDYIIRLWDSDLFLHFDGDYLHLPNESYNWKTGKLVNPPKIDPDKVNNNLDINQTEKVKFLLDQIVSAWYKENNDETQLLKRKKR